MTEHAYFAAGCFWGPQNRFDALEGVTETEVGYTGGHVDKPDYKLVCTGTTGHAETVHVTFDPDIISYNELLEAFWEMHDPTTYHRQGPDVGSQYRSAIFTTSQEQSAAAEASKQAKTSSFASPIVTEIVPLDTFWRAEDYHQHYHQKMR